MAKKVKKKILCPDCGTDQEYFARGRCGRCYARQYYWENRKAILERARHSGRKVLYNREYHRKHKKEVAIRHSRYYDDNRETILAHQAEYREKNPEKIAVKNRRYYAEHRIEINKRNRQWQKENRDKMNIIQARYRARKESLPHTLTAEQLAQKLSIDRCFYCEVHCENLTYDHFVPVSKGGGTTLANGVAACQSCNSKKHKKLPRQFLSQLELIGTEKDL